MLYMWLTQQGEMLARRITERLRDVKFNLISDKTELRTSTCEMFSSQSPQIWVTTKQMMVARIVGMEKSVTT